MGDDFPRKGNSQMWESTWKPELPAALGVVISPLEKREGETPNTPLDLEGGIDLH